MQWLTEEPPIIQMSREKESKRIADSEWQPNDNDDIKMFKMIYNTQRMTLWRITIKEDGAMCWKVKIANYYVSLRWILWIIFCRSISSWNKNRNGCEISPFNSIVNCPKLNKCVRHVSHQSFIYSPLKLQIDRQWSDNDGRECGNKRECEKGKGGWCRFQYRGGTCVE